MSAESDSVWIEADSGINTSDSENDGGARIDTTGDDLDHDYYIEARADEEQEHDSGCKGENCTTVRYQERYDCIDDFTYYAGVKRCP
ncbi:hypothetical protein BRC81_13290 [Halobacteriales archaeon QS_1_68_20]|nr:MAG: hypothetical protein BRC81_13290 [Halobacteriales archaeon QS_1_68_20]